MAARPAEPTTDTVVTAPGAPAPVAVSARAPAVLSSSTVTLGRLSVVAAVRSAVAEFGEPADCGEHYTASCSASAVTMACGASTTTATCAPSATSASCAPSALTAVIHPSELDTEDA